MDDTQVVNRTEKGTHNKGVNDIQRRLLARNRSKILDLYL